MNDKCAACAKSYMEPNDMNLVCGHPDGGMYGIYARLAVQEDGHCGPERKKFSQHPLRNADGTLKRIGSSGSLGSKGET